MSAGFGNPYQDFFSGCVPARAFDCDGAKLKLQQQSGNRELRYFYMHLGFTVVVLPEFPS